jgi:hypothetical protein
VTDPIFHEHDAVVLVRDLPAEGLVSGAVGTIVWVGEDGFTFEVEFVDSAGATIAVATVTGDCIRARCAR